MKWAIIENNLVVNVIIADDKFIKANSINAICIDEVTEMVGIGWSYANQTFIAPPMPIESDGFGVGDKYVDGEFISNQIKVPIDETLA